jgi:Fe2+ transport system protein FeoA
MTLFTCPMNKPIKIKHINMDASSTFRISRLGMNINQECTVILRHKHHIIVSVKGVRYGLDHTSAQCIEVAYD